MTTAERCNSARSEPKEIRRDGGRSRHHITVARRMKAKPGPAPLVVRDGTLHGRTCTPSRAAQVRTWMRTFPGSCGVRRLPPTKELPCFPTLAYTSSFGCMRPSLSPGRRRLFRIEVDPHVAMLQSSLGRRGLDWHDRDCDWDAGRAHRSSRSTRSVSARSETRSEERVFFYGCGCPLPATEMMFGGAWSSRVL